MTFIKNNIWTIACIAIIAILTMAGDASAQTISTNSSIENIAKNKTASVFAAARNIMFVVGGFGLIAVAFMAIAGKVQWKMVASIGIGLGIIAAASAVINYAITNDGNSKAYVDYGDTLGN